MSQLAWTCPSLHTHVSSLYTHVSSLHKHVSAGLGLSQFAAEVFPQPEQLSTHGSSSNMLCTQEANQTLLYIFGTLAVSAVLVNWRQKSEHGFATHGSPLHMMAYGG